MLHKTKQSFARPYVLSASTTSLVAVFSAVLILLAFDGRSPVSIESTDDELSQIVRIDFPADTNSRSDSGVGAGEQGRVGLSSGKGEGLRPEPARSQGGGGGGLHSQTPTQEGRVPHPSDIPAPIPNRAPALPPTLPAAGMNIDPAMKDGHPVSMYMQLEYNFNLY